MKVATWNLDQLAPDPARSAWQQEHIGHIKADVWVFTETHRNLSPGDGYECIASSPLAHDIPSEGGRWVAIWCKREQAANPIELGFDQERCAAVKLSSGVVIVGTGLPWNGSMPFLQRLAEQATDWRGYRRSLRGASA